MTITVFFWIIFLTAGFAARQPETETTIFGYYSRPTRVPVVSTSSRNAVRRIK
jgi:hypothetical protein